MGDIVHIQADWYETFDENFEAEETAILDRQSGLLIVRPDLLISGTSVVSSLFCPRKAVLSERFKGTDPTNKAMLTGTIVHKLLQKVPNRSQLKLRSFLIFFHFFRFLWKGTRARQTLRAWWTPS